VFQAYAGLLDFINDVWFKPYVVDAVYDKYKQERQEGQGISHEQVWSTFGSYFINPLMADVKKNVIYPKHDLDFMASETKKATRTVTGKAGGKKIKITYRRKDLWKYGDNKFLIRHKGVGTRKTVPKFSTVIDMDVTDIDDYKKYLEDINYNILKLNERYMSEPGYMSSKQFDEVKAALPNLLEMDVGPELDKETEEYIGKMLEARYALEIKKKLDKVMAKANAKAEKSLVELARDLRKFAKDFDKKEVPTAGGKMEAERQEYVASWTAWTVAQVENYTATKHYQATVKSMPNGPEKFAYSKSEQAKLAKLRAKVQSTWGRFSKAQRLGDHPLKRAPVMKFALKKVREVTEETKDAFDIFWVTNWENMVKLTPRLKFVLQGDNAITESELRKLVAQNNESVRKIMLELEEPPVEYYGPFMVYDPSKDGTKQVALDAPVFKLKYWYEYKNKHVYLTGYYHTSTGAKVEYTSKAICRRSITIPPAGLFASPSGIGYHVYQLEHDMWQDPSESIMIVMQMNQAVIKQIHRLRTLSGFALDAPTAAKPNWVLKYWEYNLDKPEAQRRKIQKSIILP
jgi:hypothetical protein